MSNKQYGLTKERQVKKMLEQQGYQAYRQRGSFGCYDIIARNNKEWKLVQVKATKQKYVSYGCDIQVIRNDQVPENTSKELWIYWSPCKGRDKKGWEIIKIV
jgi:Holliday junction resolvase-like predicted endonuclease